MNSNIKYLAFFVCTTDTSGEWTECFPDKTSNEGEYPNVISASSAEEAIQKAGVVGVYNIEARPVHYIDSGVEYDFR